ncbi:hypothetical protein PILCRDRAFT_60772 [Piloderma croceum F 1598]|uniref:Uncharacterized protein n=1 Tax=Piloderma croceum (strain F 1598) TaxID=765440 RepID=A0A0C3GDH7_PILCF|nr:hypothetical protein PILCRDRAFT_60772 [Piloderma croceum F 1598]
MPNRQIEQGIKLAGVKLYDHGVLSLATILDVLGYSQRTFFRTLRLWRKTGDVVSAPSNMRGCLCALNYNDITYLLLLIEQNPDYFLDELLDLLATNRFISVHFSTILRTLECTGVSCKKLRKIALERDEFCRADYVHRMSQYPPEYLSFLDETSKDERTLTRGYGSLDGIVACKAVEGSMTKELFLEWLEFNVV